MVDKSKKTGPAFALGVFLLLLGGITALGWLLQIQVLVRPLPALGSMALLPALLLALGGLWLIAPRFSGGRSRLADFCAGLPMLLLPGAVLVQYIFAVDLGVDMHTAHAWLTEKIGIPSRMAPNSCLAFMLAGLLICVPPRLFESPRLQLLAELGIYILIALALFGLLGYVLQLEWLYRWFSASRMVVPTAVGLITLGIGLWLNVRPPQQRDAAGKITLFATSLLLTVAVVSGLTGFALLKTGMEDSLSANLMQTARLRSQLFEQEAEDAMNITRAVTAHPGMQQAVHRLNQVPYDGAAQRQLYEIGQGFLALDLSSLQFYDHSGVLIGSVGQAVEVVELRVPIRVTATQAELFWSEGFVLRSRLPLFSEGRLQGHVVTEKYMPLFDHVFVNTEGRDESGELKVCGRRDDMLDCFPSRLVPRVHSLPFFKNGQPSFPAAHAILGESGLKKIVDIRGERVFAAYTPIGDTGLGLVAKIDSRELFRPLHGQIGKLIAFPLILLAIGIYLVRARLGPLAGRLVKAEAEWKLREKLMMNLADAVPSWVAYVDWQQHYRWCNKPYLDALGLDMREVEYKSMREILGEETYAVIQPYVERVLKGEIVSFERPMKTGRGELLVEARYVPDHSASGLVRGFYVMLWDITGYRHKEQVLIKRANVDALTGLLNRNAMVEALEATLRQAAAANRPFALFFLDIDKFKHINDSRGHATGDEVLIEFARRLQETVRASDLVARFGGDEFVILLPDVPTPEIAERIAQEIVEEIVLPMQLSTGELRTSTSVGVAYIRHFDRTVKDLLNATDEALYEAKGAGRNRYIMKRL